MHRSSSSSRVSDEFFNNSSPSQSHPQNLETAPLNPHHQLPLYNPLSTAAKMERSRLRSAENAIHIIPLLLLLCALILWLFSSPESRV
ncbi:hypothetical protein V6N11_084104 [Hibiscus sabdariffa]|uniref:Uncharacterized protein n=1 Tax=Hibiscus sabdariffa TaxID=183260 RepID=A0ABR2QDG7_9ROSI